ncbi:hypothetical protein ACIBTZ_21005 [Micromonospora sp. NPDC049460]|uniref:hypothetical protein n=1 Tax=Micromonospora sp. NPDC049460 TaxID=3364272 RepID=UPI0037A669FF
MLHERHIFRNPPPSTPVEVRAALDRGDLPAALHAMVGTALYAVPDSLRRSASGGQPKRDSRRATICPGSTGERDARKYRRHLGLRSAPPAVLGAAMGFLGGARVRVAIRARILIRQYRLAR